MVTRRRSRAARLVVGAVAIALAVAGCTDGKKPSSAPDKTLEIVAGSEQKAILEQIVKPWCDKHGYTCNYTLKGSVDQARLLQAASTDFDAYWFASTAFEQFGNTGNKLTDVEPMFKTPIVYAGRASVMQKIGLKDKDSVTIDDVLKVVQSKQVKTWSTNPTQSNSGATTLFSFMSHFAGNGPSQPLTQAQLDDPSVDEGVTAFAQSMDKTPPSTGTMMQQCVDAPDACDTLFTYEALVIEQNQNLVKQGKEPFYAVYPTGSLAISDAPFGFLPTGKADDAKKKIFTELQQFLLTDAGAKSQIQGLGRRPADSIGLTLDSPDKAVFNPAWGIKTDIKEQGITYPNAAVMEESLNRYQLKYRKPVNTFYCLDGSGSMFGNGGWTGVQNAATEIFDPAQAQKNLLQTGPKDRTTVEIFDDRVAAGPWTVDGNDGQQLKDVEAKIKAYKDGGGTNMYRCLDDAVTELSQDPDPNRKKLIVVMSDGQSMPDSGALAKLRQSGIPAVAIAFGKDVDAKQLQGVGNASGGAYVQSNDLVAALREAAGYK